MAKSDQTTPKAESGTTQNELDRLRDILYGEHSRETSVRLTELEALMEKNRQEFNQLVREWQTTLTERIDSLATDISQRIEKLDKAHTDKRDKLQQELLTITSDLESSKVARDELGAMLIEIGQRLQGEK
jgi:hypothetical protein